MTTTAEKIAIMQAFTEGKQIEYIITCRDDDDTPWQPIPIKEPQWNWYVYTYRISPFQPKPKKIAYAFITSSGDLRWTIQLPYPAGCLPIPSEDKEVEIQ